MAAGDRPIEPRKSPVAGRPASDRVRLRRRPDRAHYDRATIDAILDEALVGHVGWVLDGQPYVTPVSIWRAGDRLYWHGSAGSRMVRATETGAPVCVTVSILDGLVLALSATNHSMNYRSVMVLGRARIVEDKAEKATALDALVDRLAPGRSKEVRPASDAELRQTAVLWVDLAEVSAKVRTGGPLIEPGDEAWPAWAGIIALATTRGTPEGAPEP
jgi:nitroimidazol reductase NimA-like FMN-containing flavoprotein (pyridoxamine 5'-phosphate oxidase superfamily)